MLGDILSEKKLIVVLGPHRSGTSLCTHAIEVLGAETGLAEIHTSDENSKGFFEHESIITLNEKLLEHIGGSWDNPCFDGASALVSANTNTFFRQAKELLTHISGNAKCVVLKDPRLCQLLPFWQGVFAACGFTDLRYVHIFRNPVEVALSQQQRVKNNPSYYEIGREVREGGALWLSLTAQSMATAHGKKNHLIAYQSLLETPNETLQKLADFLDLSPNTTDVEDFCRNFLDRNLHRNIADAETRAELDSSLPQISEIETLIQPSCDTGGLSDSVIDAISAIYARADTRLALLESQICAHSRLSTKLRNLHATYAALENRSIDIYGMLKKIRLKIQKHYNDINNYIPYISPLQIWLATRKAMVQIYALLSRRTPRLARFLRGFVIPLVRRIDRAAFKLRHLHFFASPHSKKAARIECYQAHSLKKDDNPLVTVIVPNYNHAPYLNERLDSIYNQTYRNFEVLLMDDCSSDDSVAVLESYAKQHPERTRLIRNEKNSGGVFHQWEKGIKLARGSLIWIAESDDYCTDNFLETLVPYFRNEAVMLAYARTDFVRNQEKTPFWSINEYLHDIDPNRWQSSFIETAPNIVKQAFALKNIIPNVSSAMFRKVESLEILYDPQWKKMRTCGDWILYLHLLRGGLIAYSPEAVNFYRIHGSNTSVSSYKQDVFYKEHEEICRVLRQYYHVPMAILEKQKQLLVTHWQQSRDDYSDVRFSGCYNLGRVEKDTPNRAPNLLMVGYGFCAGGGETFPIFLANLMKATGYNVTFLDCNQTPRVEEIRRSLRSDIPVVTSHAELNNIAQEFNIQLIHSHHSWVDNSILQLLFPKTLSKTIVTMHGMYELMETQDAKYILPDLIRETAQIVYTAEKNLSAVKQHNLYNPDNMTRIDNALEVYPVTPLALSELSIPDDAFVLTLVSRAVEEKGWFEAVEAVKRARDLCDRDIHLILIGEGSAYDALKQKNLPAYIHLEGFRQNIRAYFAASHIGLLPTRFKGESFPLVLIDSLHAGTPVLASTVGEIPYMLETEDGLAGSLFDLEEDWSINCDMLAGKIAELASDDAFYKTLKARTPKAAAKFDPKHLCEAYDRVYQRALSTVA